jgi:predicted amidohydrolase
MFGASASTGRAQFSVICALAVVLASGSLVFRLTAADVSRELKVASIQLRSTFDIQRNCDRITAHLKRLAGEGVQVAVFPECALTGYETRATFAPSAAEVQAAEKQIQKTCREEKIGAIVGSVYRVNGHLYDTAVVFDSHGEMVERYGKLHLAGEKWATPGNHLAFFELEGIPSSVMICHDERYPELARLPAIKGARVMYYISAESGLRKEKKLAPYRAQVMARAVENGVFIVQANAPANSDLSGSHGQSRIVAVDGNVLNEASFFGEDVLVNTLPMKKGNLQRPLEDFLGQWWKEGVDSLMSNRHRQLD